MVRIKVVLLVMPPPAAVTVTEKVPVGVELLALTVNTLEQFGLQAGEEKEPLAPEGRPETVKEMGWGLPDDKKASIVVVTEEFAVTDLFPEFESAKSKAAAVPVILNVKLVLRVIPPPLAVTIIG